MPRDETTLLDIVHAARLAQESARAGTASLQCRWSSYRYYELNDRGILEMNRNGGWPIEW